MVLNVEEGLEYEVFGDRISSDNVSEFKYLGCVLDESGRDRGECSCGKRVGSIMRSLINARDL